MKHLIRLAISGLLLFATASNGSAEVLATATRTTDFADNNTNFLAVPLRNGASSFDLNFRTTKRNQLVVFTYNAECHNNTDTGFVELRFLVTAIPCLRGAGIISLCAPTMNSPVRCGRRPNQSEILAPTRSGYRSGRSADRRGTASTTQVLSSGSEFRSRS